MRAFVCLAATLLFVSSAHAEDCNYLHREEVTCVSLSPEKLHSLIGLTENQIRSNLHSQGQGIGEELHFNSMAYGRGTYSGGIDINFTNGHADVVSGVLTRDDGENTNGMTMLHFIENSRTGFVCFDGNPAQKC